ncbi:MAG: hypothetical protein GX900_05670 [Clostridiaceae bacterium]|nr:hypothetical protein [Clostridiaceae bacterium]
MSMEQKTHNQSTEAHVWCEEDKLYLWMQLLGFDVTQPDYGVGELLKRMQMQPHAVMLYVFSPDIIHLHEGMEREVVFPADYCASYGCARNHLRYRQAWTNYDLRGLVRVLREHNIDAYLSIMGRSMQDFYHKEWLSEHKEILMYGENLFMNVLRRLNDGSYYEDFFVEKCYQAVRDYGLKGVHLADCFCPVEGSCYSRDYSADFVDQFVQHTGLKVPAEIATGFDTDAPEQLEARRRWIWGEHRELWIRFSAWRWQGFMEKLCGSLARLDAKVSILGAYLTDPFETLYITGIDLAALIAAGVDSVTLNVLPDSVRGPGLANLLHKLVNMLPLMGAQIGSEHLLSMIGVKDSTEEFDVLAHRPASLERTTYMALGYQLAQGQAFQRAASGLLVCLADGVTADQWETLRGWFKETYSHDVTEVSGPFVLWSQYAQDRLLPEYIATRRWSPHKYLTELSRRGLIFGGATRAETLNGLRNPLFVPNYDLLSATEKAAVQAYAGPVIGTVPVGFDWTTEVLQPQFRLADRDVRYPQEMFAVIPDATAESLAELTAELAAYPERPDTREEYAGDLVWAQESLSPFSSVEKGDFLDPGDTLYFSKISLGFLEALTELFMRLRRQTEPLTVNLPYTLVRRSDGTYLLCIYNTCEYYSKFHVQARYPIRRVTNVTDFPLLPAKFFVGKGDQGFVARYEEDFPFSDQRREFYNKVAPDGVAAFIVELDGV